MFPSLHAQRFLCYHIFYKYHGWALEEGKLQMVTREWGKHSACKVYIIYIFTLYRGGHGGGGALDKQVGPHKLEQQYQSKKN